MLLILAKQPNFWLPVAVDIFQLRAKEQTIWAYKDRVRSSEAPPL
jgi:hypothetical protein